MAKHDHNHHEHDHCHAHHGHSHSHGHSHGHHHHAPPDKLTFAFSLSIILNLGFTIIEATYAVLAHSMSLLADAGHNLGDVLGLAFAGFASWLLTKNASHIFSYGYKKTSIIAAMTNAIILVVVSTLIAYEALQRIWHPMPVNETIIMVVALIGIVINGGTALLFMRGRHDDLNVKGAFLHLAGDAVISLGVVIAGGLIFLTHQYWIDPVVSLIIVVLILWSTWRLLGDSFKLLMAAVPNHIDLNGVTSYLSQLPGVSAIHDLHIWGLSTQEVALTAHLVMPEEPMDDVKRKEVHQTLAREFKIHHVTLQIEKEGTDCLQEDRCTPKHLKACR